MACSKPKSSIGVDRGAVSRRSNSPPSNGSTGSTIVACSNRLEISRPQKRKRVTMPRLTSASWRRHPNQTASGKPGAVQSAGRGISVRAAGRGGASATWCYAQTADGSQAMNRSAAFVIAAALGLATAPDAFGWGAVSGPAGGAAYRGPAGGAAVRGPYGGAAARGPYGGAAVRGPAGAAAVRAPYGGGAVYVGGVRPWVRAPYYGAVVAGVAIGAIIATTAVPPAPAPPSRSDANADCGPHAAICQLQSPKSGGDPKSGTASLPCSLTSSTRKHGYHICTASRDSLRICSRSKLNPAPVLELILRSSAIASAVALALASSPSCRSPPCKV